jgi:hypothetical protein
MALSLSRGFLVQQAASLLEACPSNSRVFSSAATEQASGVLYKTNSRLEFSGAFLHCVRYEPS